MRINISSTVSGFNAGELRVFDPITPRPPGINSILDVQRFEASRTLVAPFEGLHPELGCRTEASRCRRCGLRHQAVI